MQKVLTAEEMREVDRLTTENYGIPSIILMENAAHAVARVIAKKLGGSVKDKSFLILCGKGNNGGDGAALARVLWSLGAWVDVFLFGSFDQTKGDARSNFETLARLGADEEPLIYFNEEGDFESWRKRNLSRETFDVVVDAIFGTGLTGPVESPLADILAGRWFQEKKFRDCASLVVAIDVPSGLDADWNERIGDCVRTDLTVTFTAPKLANVLPPASNFGGELWVANIGSPPELIEDTSSQTFLAENIDANYWTSQTEFFSDSYKNKRGKALLIAGSIKYSGAGVLVGNGAMQSGVGLVTVVTSESARNAVSERILPEVMVEGVAETETGSISESAYERIDELSAKADVIGIGSGLGSDEGSTRNLVRKVVEERKTPVVIDADGLNALSPFDLEGAETPPLILTPHEGEFLRLLGTDDKDVLKDRVQAVRDFAEKHNVILVLKGERTLIGEPGGKVVINPTGNSGLGKAGNGDNFTGIITGFVAQAVQMDVNVFETVVAAVYIAGLAGDFAEKKFGKRTMLASDVRDCLAQAFAEVEKIDD